MKNSAETTALLPNLYYIRDAGQKSCFFRWEYKTPAINQQRKARGQKILYKISKKVFHSEGNVILSYQAKAKQKMNQKNFQEVYQYEVGLQRLRLCT
ncbi:MAG: hypothetical protein IJB81_09470 [Clostridia bacterium]|nr:hypothetical protein [Clostridia bacterium]